MIICKYCNREFKGLAGLMGHIRMIHPAVQPMDGQKLEERLREVEMGMQGLIRGLEEDLIPTLKSLKADALDSWASLQTSLLLHFDRQHGIKYDIERLPDIVRKKYKQALESERR